MSSRYTITNTSSQLVNSDVIAVWNVAGAFVSPNGMTRNSYVP